MAKITYLPYSDKDGVYNWPQNRLWWGRCPDKKGVQQKLTKVLPRLLFARQTYYCCIVILTLALPLASLHLKLPIVAVRFTCQKPAEEPWDQSLFIKRGGGGGGEGEKSVWVWVLFSWPSPWSLKFNCLPTPIKTPFQRWPSPPFLYTPGLSCSKGG